MKSDPPELRQRAGQVADNAGTGIDAKEKPRMSATSANKPIPGGGRPSGVRPMVPGAVGGARPNSAATIDPIRVIRQHLWGIALGVIGGVIVGVVAHYVWAYTYPIHQAQTFWRVNLPAEETASVSGETNMSGDQMDRTIATAAAIVMSPNVLRQAITAPEVLSTQWIKDFRESSGNVRTDEALDDLESRLRAAPHGDTFLVRVSITGHEKDDLVKMLTAVNTEYQRELQRMREENRQDAIGQLTVQKNTLQSNIQALQGEIALRIEQKNITPDIANSDQAMELNLIRQNIAEQLANLSMANQAAGAMESRLQEASLVYNDSERAAARQDPNVAQLETTVVMLRASLREARTRFGEGHREIQRLENRLSASESELDSETQRVLERNFLSNLEYMRNQVRAFQQGLVDLENQRVQAETRFNDLVKDAEWVATKRTELEAMQAQLSELNSKITDASIIASMKRTLQATLASPPEADPLPLMPKIVVMVPLGVLIVGGLTTGFIFLREMTDRRVKGPGCVAMLPRGHVIGVVPHLEEDPTAPPSIELIQRDRPTSIIAESIRQVHVPMLRRMREESARSIVFAPGQPGAGCSAVVSNLAITFARSDRRVLLIDADLRRPRQDNIFSLMGEYGLSDVLNGKVTLEDAVQDTGIPNLSALSAGSDDTRESLLLGSANLDRLIENAESRFDLVLVDSPAAVAASDWELLANAVDANVLVVRAMQEERGLVSRLIARMSDVNSTHLGVIVNGLRSSAGGYLKRNLQHMGRYQNSA